MLLSFLRLRNLELPPAPLHMPAPIALMKQLPEKHLLESATCPGRQCGNGDNACRTHRHPCKSDSITNNEPSSCSKEFYTTRRRADLRSPRFVYGSFVLWCKDRRRVGLSPPLL